MSSTQNSVPTSSSNGDEKLQASTAAAPSAVNNGDGNDDADQHADAHTDFIVREGFPALRLPDGGGANIEGEEPLPRHKFWGNEEALTFDHLETLWADCETVFSARTREDGQAYSEGITYFIPCQMKPRCALEALVLSIFNKHTETLDKTIFVPEQSGAEWWTLVLDDDEDGGEKKQPSTGTEDEGEEGDEVGLHFDADYGLEAQAPGFLLHPRLATVTYLSDFGSPTLVLDLKSPPPMDSQKKSIEGSIRRGWLSLPKIGKHIAFDGRLLHGAPSTFFPGLTSSALSSKPQLKRARQQRKRITLLVNIWLNHCPLDAEPIEDEVVEQLKTPWVTDTAKTDSRDKPFKQPYTWNPLDLDKPAVLKKLMLSTSKEDEAGSEEFVLCNRLVSVSYKASMEDFHNASKEASLAELVMERDVITLEVGDEVNDSLTDSNNEDSDEK